MTNTFFLPTKRLIFSSLVSAATLLWSASALSAERGWWGSLESGATFTAKDHRNHIGMMPNPGAGHLYDDYKTTHREDGYLIGLSGGYQFGCPEDCERTWFPNARVGLGYEFVGETKVDGDVNKYQEKTYYNFQYKTYSQVAWALGQLDIITWKNFTPFIDAAIGVAFNSARDYDEHRISREVPVRESARFSNKTSAEFAWRAGLGVNYSIPRYVDDPFYKVIMMTDC